MFRVTGFMFCLTDTLPPGWRVEHEIHGLHGIHGIHGMHWYEKGHCRIASNVVDGFPRLRGNAEITVKRTHFCQETDYSSLGGNLHQTHSVTLGSAGSRRDYPPPRTNFSSPVKPNRSYATAANSIPRLYEGISNHAGFFCLVCLR